MGQLTARGIDEIQDDYPNVYEALLSTIQAVNGLGQATGNAANGVPTSPQNTCQLFVVAQDGIFDVAVADPAPQQAELYFLEYDTSISFQNAKTIFLGPGRSWRGELGNQSLYFRVYKQLAGSNVSGYVYFGNPPSAVAGGGSLAGPTPQDTTGSGTSQVPGYGFGQVGQIQPMAANL